MRGRIWVWLIPPSPPIKAFRPAIVEIVKRHRWGVMEEKIIRGAIFCQVVRRIHAGHLSEDITCGNQKWNGAAPILISRLVSIKSVAMLGGITVNNGVIVLRAARSKMPDPRAWVKKYLIAASVSWFECVCVIRE